MNLDSNMLLHSSLLAACKRFPERVAAQDHDARLTFKSLHSRATFLAAMIEDLSKNRKTEQIPIVVYGNKSSLSLVGALASLMSGDIYVPLDPLDPPSLLIRKLSILGEYILLTTDIASDASIFISKNTKKPISVIDIYNVSLKEINFTSQSSSIHTRYIKDEKIINPKNIAYILFTSGSTGNPRAVAVSHVAAKQANTAICRDFAFHKDDRMLGQVSLSFDISLWDFFAGLPAGATWIPLPLEIDDQPNSIADYIAEYKITSIATVPSLFRFLNEKVDDPINKLSSLRRILLTGEPIDDAVHRQLIEWLPAEARIFDLFGATEMPHVLFREIERDKPPSQRGFSQVADCVEAEFVALDLNRPLEHHELRVRGPSILSGYRMSDGTIRDVLTDDGAYRTGDLFLPGDNGDWVPAGRLDRQCKINGFRVNLDTVEAVAEESASVRACAALLDSNGRLVLFAEISEEGAGNDLIVADIKAASHHGLPHYAQPYRIEPMTVLPRTRSGKKNREILRRHPAIIGD